MEPTSTSTITAHLRAHPDPVTAEAVCAATGLPIREVRDTLLALLSQYRGTVDLAPDSGVLTYVFIHPLTPRHHVTLCAALAKGLTLLWRLVTGAPRAVIGVTLLLMYTLFGLLPIAVFGGGRGRDRRTGTLHASQTAGIASLLWELLRGIAYGVTGYTGARRIIYRTHRRHGVFRIVQTANLADGANNLAFGSGRVLFTDAERARRAMERLRRNHGLLTASDLIALEGHDWDTAEGELMRLASHMGGALEVMENGTVVAMVDATALPANPPDPQDPCTEFLTKQYWEETEPRYFVTGNTADVYAWIGSFMVAPTGIAFSPLMQPRRDRGPWFSRGEWAFFDHLKLICLVLVILLFGMPLLRAPIIMMLNRTRRSRDVRRRLLGVIHEQRGAQQVERQVILGHASLRNDPPALVAAVLDRLVLDLKAETDVDDDGVVHHHFDRFHQGLAVAS